MRFTIPTQEGPIEVIGDLVDIPEAPGEQFAIHINPLRNPESEYPPNWKTYRVTHLGTGCRAKGGSTIEEAIGNTRKRFAELTPEQIAETFAKARITVAEWVRRSEAEETSA